MTSWVPGDPDELAWLVSVATDKDDAGYEVGPMPDIDSVTASAAFQNFRDRPTDRLPPLRGKLLTW